jgi:hypothetical protein
VATDAASAAGEAAPVAVGDPGAPHEMRVHVEKAEAAR